jgi:hypothetical protein
MAYTVEIETGTGERKAGHKNYGLSDAEAKARRVYRTLEDAQLFGWAVIILEDDREYSREEVS